MSHPAWLLAAILAPLLLVILTARARTRELAFVLAPWATLPALLLALAGAVPTELRLPFVLLGTQLALDSIGKVFLLFTALIGALGGFALRTELARDDRRFRFTACYLTAYAGNVGVVLAADVVSFYSFFTLMTLAAYGLVYHHATPATRRAGKIYIVFALLGEMLLLAALLLATGGATALADVASAIAASPWRNTIMALLLAGFGVKAGLLPLHMSLPVAYAAAPIAGATLLAGAMIKAGLLGWLRLLPLGLIALPQWGMVCTTAGMLAMFYGVAAGLGQTNAKALLAYSSISQMGFMTVALGLGLFEPSLWPPALAAILVYALHHAFTKTALFLGVGAVEQGVDRRWVAAALLVPALILAGAPFSGGAIAKFYLKNTLGAAPGEWPQALYMLLPFAAAGTALLMVRFVFLLMRVRRIGRSQVPFSVILTIALGLSAAGVWWMPSVDVAALRGHWSEVAAWWEESWPIVAATVVGFIASRLLKDRPASRPFVPLGDLLVAFERLWQSIRRRTRNPAWIGRRRRPDVPGAATPTPELLDWPRQWESWPVAGTGFLLLIAVLFLLMFVV